MTARRLAVGLTPMETRRDVMLHVADRAQELGFDAFFLAEGWGHDAGVLLAEVATRTDRITLGTGIVNVWGRTPASISMLATSLAELSGDRFVLGSERVARRWRRDSTTSPSRHRSSGWAR